MIITFQAILVENVGIVITKSNNQQGVLIFRRPCAKNEPRTNDDYFRINLGKQYMPLIDEYIVGNIYNLTVDIHGVTNDANYAIAFWMLSGIKLVKDPALYKKWGIEMKI